jgi:hypothetical protein
MMNIIWAIITGLTGAVIAVESLILFVGVRFVASEGEQWICLKNDLLVVVDIVTGVGLIMFALLFKRFSGLSYVSIFYVLIMISIITHGYREWEYLTGVGNRFFFNLPLFVFNNIRLLGLIVAAVWAMMEAGKN